MDSLRLMKFNRIMIAPSRKRFKYQQIVREIHIYSTIIQSYQFLAQKSATFFIALFLFIPSEIIKLTTFRILFNRLHFLQSIQIKIVITRPSLVRLYSLFLCFFCFTLLFVGLEFVHVQFEWYHVPHIKSKIRLKSCDSQQFELPLPDIVAWSSWNLVFNALTKKLSFLYWEQVVTNKTAQKSVEEVYILKR